MSDAATIEPIKRPVGRPRQPKVSTDEIKLRRLVYRYKKFWRYYPDLGSLNNLFTPYANRLYGGLKEPVEIALMCARLLGKTDRDVRKVLHKWDMWREEDRLFEHALDFCVTETKQDLEQFKQKLLGVARAISKLSALARVDAALPEIVDRAVNIAGDSEKDKGNRVLTRILERNDLLDKPPGQVSVNVNANPTVNAPVFGASADEFSAMLDRALQSKEQKALPPAVDVEFEEVKE